MERVPALKIQVTRETARLVLKRRRVHATMPPSDRWCTLTNPLNQYLTQFNFYNFEAKKMYGACASRRERVGSWGRYRHMSLSLRGAVSGRGQVKFKNPWLDNKYAVII